MSDRHEQVLDETANVVTAHGMLDQLCVVAWMQGGKIKVMAPRGFDEAAAIMLYRAADTFSDRAMADGAPRRFKLPPS